MLATRVQIWRCPLPMNRTRPARLSPALSSLRTFLALQNSPGALVVNQTPTRNPEGCQTVAGGRSVAQTPGKGREQARSTILALALAVGWAATTFAQPLSPPAARAVGPPPMVLTVERTNVSIQRFRSAIWERAYPSQVLGAKDHGRTGARSRTSVRLSDLSVLRIDELSEFEIQPLPEPTVEAEFSLFRGLLYLLNRDRPGKHRFVTPTSTAATRGTEFTLEVDPATGRTVLTVLEGEAELSNAAGSV